MWVFCNARQPAGASAATSGLHLSAARRELSRLGVLGELLHRTLGLTGATCRFEREPVRVGDRNEALVT